MKIREFIMFGARIELWDFGGSQFLYPTFNGNAEFKVNHKGFRELSHYIRTCNYFDKMIKECYA